MVAHITTAHESSHLVQWTIQKSSQLFNRHRASASDNHRRSTSRRSSLSSGAHRRPHRRCLPLEIGRGPPNLPLMAPRELPSRRQTMSTEEEPKKSCEDDAEATPEWHRARARRLRKSGFTKMAQKHEQIAQMIESRRQQQTK